MADPLGFAGFTIGLTIGFLVGKRKNLKLEYAVLKGITIITMILSLIIFLISDDPRESLLYLAAYFALALILFILSLMEDIEREYERRRGHKNVEQED